MRENTSLESLKGENRKQGGFKCGRTVPGRRELTRSGGDVERSVGEHATDSSQPCRKGRIVDRMLALEAAYEEYRVEHTAQTGAAGL